MNNDHRRDGDVCQRRRRRGAYAAVLGAAVGAALAAPLIAPALALADATDDAVAAAVAGDSVSDAARQPVTEFATLNRDIVTLDGDLGLKFLANPDVQLTDSLLGLLPGGATGTDATEVETFLVNDFYDPLIADFGGGSSSIAADAVSDVTKQPAPELGTLNHDITIVDDDLGLKFLANPEIQFTDSLLGLYPGGAEGTLATEVETFLVNDFYNPLIDIVGGGGGMMAF
jgi:hypothetical protein